MIKFVRVRVDHNLRYHFYALPPQWNKPSYQSGQIHQNGRSDLVYSDIRFYTVSDFPSTTSMLSKITSMADRVMNYKDHVEISYLLFLYLWEYLSLIPVDKDLVNHPINTITSDQFVKCLYTSYMHECINHLRILNQSTSFHIDDKKL